MISRKKVGVIILQAKMFVLLSHRVKRKIAPWFICPVWSSTFVKYPFCQVSKISNDYFCILALSISEASLGISIRGVNQIFDQKSE